MTESILSEDDRGVTAVWGIPIIDRLPDEAYPVGEEVDWRDLDGD